MSIPSQVPFDSESKVLWSHYKNELEMEQTLTANICMRTNRTWFGQSDRKLVRSGSLIVSSARSAIKCANRTVRFVIPNYSYEPEYNKNSEVGIIQTGQDATRGPFARTDIFKSNFIPATIKDWYVLTASRMSSNAASEESMLRYEPQHQNGHVRPVKIQGSRL